MGFNSGFKGLMKSKEIKETVFVLFILQNTNVRSHVAEKHEVMISVYWMELVQDRDYLANTVINT